MNKQKKLLVMAGGTGGHIFPAIAVAQKLQKQGWEICWLGTKDRMEAQLVPQYGIPIRFIQISGLRGKGIKALLTAPYAILRAVLQAKKIIQEEKPEAVLGMGGYVSGPGGVAAKLCGVPIILHEQNAIAGLTNKWLAKIATRVLQGFPKAFLDAEVVGNPVRQDLFSMPTPQVRFAGRDEKLRVLVVGGSQGAKVLNETLPKVVAQLSNKLKVRHQVGKGNVENVIALYGENAAQVNITEFIDDMAEAYAWADVVICRSGALTVCELAAIGAAAIFVPFQHKDKQQYLNAKYLADVGAAKIVEQADLTPGILIDYLQHFTRDDLLAMAIKAKAMATPFAAQRVADVIIENAK
ncbi:undecaprenyldiphospho-muramoylpentapeptide beta-N-acetylglucosaminyltransferase [Rodentibacter trehalosifermentans]|uniref:UDP-N-acetylglucosamine--N-acetylmuramyl-(pentapeptide) pyrophosphoryl-undecaprenol N-acetylglucosamine transferase n=1 Tax=Rodentibacter trehalosifermentans TaxID=1908263 RepID=A0A1V3IY84_9PAST|nr:undecaprenyldiphospho-muramoylpentapeptide beta-N-acetylglucosaminyltransferase [Rodentibacter trehalosifermentans]OOF44145.1 undecaprenyldiphospho-muramoylpentapeptide beta-N-acetylglucosaminyltransferase [Rodentibacter trehalosifermentans]OOF47237.1 undecaprenyldiphospho-muramoylpentapeptide beta-N-acetylglucosaminyltransferase [Rodentibacter trehalosifermentans]OOF48260.1 undecaprenyldiphospho-muramoylpentapeptide beta-N-acetylglucosaminyltransferase [Rodentibacter trehalosifermentans]